MNIALLKTFIAVSESESLADAASRLARTQSAITKSIQRLETLLGGELFDREGYRLVLNRRGQLVLNSALEIVRREQALMSLSRSIGDTSLSSITVAYDAILPMSYLVSRVRFDQGSLAASEVTLSSRVFDGAYKLVEQGEAGVAITAMVRESGALSQALIGSLDVVNAVPVDCSDNFWESLPQCVLSDETPHTADSNRVSVSRCIRVRSIEQKAEIITSGVAWGRVPATLVEHAMTQGRVTVGEAPGVSTRQALPVYCVFDESYRSQVDRMLTQHLPE